MIFPTFEDMINHEEVVAFLCGLWDRPEDLALFICSKAATSIAKNGINHFKEEYFRRNGEFHVRVIKRTIETDLQILEKFMKEIERKYNVDDEHWNKGIPICNEHICVYSTNHRDMHQPLSKLYIFDEHYGILCQDPEYNALHDGKMMYAIGVNEEGELLPIVSVIQTLRKSHEVHISRVYSPSMYVEEIENMEPSQLKGWIKLRTHEEKDKCILEMIREITKFQSLIISDLRIYCTRCMNRQYVEQIVDLVSFSKDMKSLEVFNSSRQKPRREQMFSQHLVQQMSDKLYQNGEEMDQNWQYLHSDSERRREGSLLEILDLHLYVVRDDLRSIIRPTLLTELQTLRLSGLDLTDTFQNIFTPGYPNLRDLSLLDSKLNRTDLRTLTVLLAHGLPKLEYLTLMWIDVSGESTTTPLEEMVESTSRETIQTKPSSSLKRFHLETSNMNKEELKKIIQAKTAENLINLNLRENILTGCLGEILSSGFPSLAALNLSSTNLSKTDMEAINGARWNSLERLDLSRNILTNCLRFLLDISGSADLETRFPSLHFLILSYTCLSKLDFKVLCTSLRNGSLAQLRKLDVQQMKPNTEENKSESFIELSESWKEHFKLHQKEIEGFSWNANFEKKSPEKETNVTTNNLPGLVLFASKPVNVPEMYPESEVFSIPLSERAFDLQL